MDALDRLLAKTPAKKASGDALDRLLAKTPAKTAAEKRRENAREVVGAAKGLLLGGADVGGRIMGGVGKIAGALGAEGAQEYIERRNENLRNRKSEGAEKLGRLAGNVVGEGALAVTGGKAVGGALQAVAPASRLAKAITAGRQGSLAQRAAAQTLPFAPAEATLGALSSPDNPLKGAAVNVALGTGGGALIEGAGSGVKAIRAAATPQAGLPRNEIQRLADRAYTKVLDQDYMARLFGRTVGGTEAVSHQISRISGAKRAAAQELEEWAAVHAPVLKAARAEASQLAQAERTLELAANGSKDLTPQQLLDAQDTVARLSRNPDAVAGARAVQEGYARLLDWKYLEGVINDDQYKALKASGVKYTPLIPQWAVDMSKNIEGVDFGAGGRLLAPGTGVRKLKSRTLGTTPVVDMVEQFGVDLAQTHLLVAKQRVTNVVADIVNGNPAAAAGWIRRIPAPNQPSQYLGNVVSANVGGTRQYFEVTNSDLYQTLTKVTPDVRTAVGRILGAFKTTLRTGITYMPDFMIANATRDAVHVATQYTSSLKVGAAGAVGGAAFGAATNKDDRMGGALKGGAFGLGFGTLAPSFTRTLRAMEEVLSNSPVYREYIREGGSGFSEFYGGREDVQKVLREALGEKSFRDTILAPLRTQMDGIQLLAEMVEQAPRLARYKHARKAGLSVPESIHLGKDVSVNFGNIGSSRSIRSISNYKAFFNATLQGWDKTVRMVKDPKTAGTALALITAPSIALFHVNKDDPEYWERPVWERSMFWLVPREDGGFYRIPKPFELGFLFATVPEMLLAKHYELDPEGASRATKEMLSNQGESFLPVPTMVQPALEAFANRSLFTGQRIRDDKQVTTEQFDERTSEPAIRIGDATGASPALVDHFAGGYGGGAVRTGLDIASGLMSRDRAPAVEPRRPFIQRFLTSRATQTETERRFRERLDRAERANSSVKRAEKDEASPERLNAIRRRYAKDLEFYEANKAKANILKDAAGMRRRIRFSRDMTQPEKLQKMVEINNAVVTLLRDPDNFQGLPGL